MAKKNDKKADAVDPVDDIINDYKDRIVGHCLGSEMKAPDIISTGSFWFDYVLGGGYRGGSWSRFYGDPESGKTSKGLCWAKSWQDFYGDDGEVIVFNAEGRVTIDLLTRSGLDLSKVRVIKTNEYELIYGMTERFIKEGKKKYFMLLDSTDACIRGADLEKEYGESEKMAGGATIASAAGKRLSLLFNEGGHHLFMTSQVRVTNMNAQKGSGKDAAGGNAPKFYSSLIGEIKKPWTETLIYQKHKDTKSPIIGRMCEIKLHKTPNETTGKIVKIPIRYGLVGGVWTAYEAMMIAQAWKIYVPAKGSWFAVGEQWEADLKKNNIKFEETVNGEGQLRDHFDSNPDLVAYCLQKGKIMAAQDAIKNKVTDDEKFEGASEEL